MTLTQVKIKDIFWPILSRRSGKKSKTILFTARNKQEALKKTF